MYYGLQFPWCKYLKTTSMVCAIWCLHNWLIDPKSSIVTASSATDRAYTHQLEGSIQPLYPTGSPSTCTEIGDDMNLILDGGDHVNAVNYEDQRTESKRQFQKIPQYSKEDLIEVIDLLNSTQRPKQWVLRLLICCKMSCFNHNMNSSRYLIINVI